MGGGSPPSRGDPPPFLVTHRWPERNSTGWQLGHECVTVAVESRVEGGTGGGVVGRSGLPRHVGSATSVQRDVAHEITTRPAQKGGVGQRRTRRIEYRHKRVLVAAVEGGVEGAGGSGVVGGGGLPRHVGPALSHRDAEADFTTGAEADITTRPTKEGRVGQLRTRGVELRNEGVTEAIVGGVE